MPRILVLFAPSPDQTHAPVRQSCPGIFPWNIPSGSWLRCSSLLSEDGNGPMAHSRWWPMSRNGSPVDAHTQIGTLSSSQQYSRVFGSLVWALTSLFAVVVLDEMDESARDRMRQELPKAVKCGRTSAVVRRGIWSSQRHARSAAGRCPRWNTRCRQPRLAVSRVLCWMTWPGSSERAGVLMSSHAILPGLA